MAIAAARKSSRRLRVGLGLPAVAAMMFTATGVLACCSVAPRGKPVAFGDQTNIIIWDAANQTEHFIREAKFRSDAPDFGFIAPTPSKPELSEASSEAFDSLEKLKPADEHFGCAKSDEAAAGAMGKALEVIQQV